MSRDLIKRLIKTATSAQDVLKIMDNECNVIIGADILKYSSIDELLGKHECAFLMYIAANSNFGHWCAIAKYGDKIQVFDPYGRYIDDYNEEFNTKIPAHLSRLLINSPYEIHYNDYKFQSDISSVCGLWCALFLKKGRIMSIDDFIEEYKNLTESELVQMFYRIRK